MTIREFPQYHTNILSLQNYMATMVLDVAILVVIRYKTIRNTLFQILFGNIEHNERKNSTYILSQQRFA